jgi:hypothetical protein
MQQATGAAGLDTTAGGNSLPSESERYVINLSASTTPVGLTAPTHPQLRHYTFFVSRKLENGRERFRLHMGYFNSLDEAEHMLELVREIYPAAWAGVATGQRLHTRVIAPGKLGGKPGARGGARPAATATPAAAATPAATPAAAPVASPAAAAVAAAPVVAPVAAPAAPVPATAAAPAQIAVAAPVAAPAAAPAPAAPPVAPPPAIEQAAAQLRLVPAPSVVPVAAAASASASATAAASESFQQIRATIDALGAPSAGTLDNTGNTVIAPGIGALREAEASGARALSGQQALQLLEQPPREYQPPARAPASDPVPAKAAAPAQRPRATRAPTASPLPSAPPVAPFYAVQLLWAVQPIDMQRVPQLAIFSAYRLYGAEGNREGRRWYGLRLGFFADSVSAQQVANYVRSEFSSVSVVPVSAGERERATRSTARPLPAAKSEERNHGMQFIDEVLTDTATSGSRPALDASPAKAPADAEAAWAAAASAAVQGGAGTRKGTAPGKRVKLRAGNRAASKHPQRKPPETLEQTLDALGASTLSLDEGRGDNMQFESTVGRTQPNTPAPNRFGKLLDRLTKRFGNP